MAGAAGGALRGADGEIVAIVFEDAVSRRERDVVIARIMDNHPFSKLRQVIGKVDANM